MEKNEAKRYADTAAQLRARDAISQLPGYATGIGSFGNAGYEADSGHLVYTRHDGVAEVRIQQYLRPELALKVEAAIRDLIATDRKEQHAAQVEWINQAQQAPEGPPTPGAIGH